MHLKNEKKHFSNLHIILDQVSTTHIFKRTKDPRLCPMTFFFFVLF